MEGRFIVSCMFIVLATGCVSISEFYSENPFAKSYELIDYDGPLKAEHVVGLTLEQLVNERASEDYLVIGSADYTGQGNLDWTGAMVRLGYKLKAEKVDYYTWEIGVDSGTRILAMPTTQNSTASVWGANGLQTINVTTTGTTMIPYNYSVPRNEFHVLYFKKMKHPFPFGISFDIPSDDIAKKIGTRNIVEVTSVVPGKLAWKNNLFKGDLILEVDGKKATVNNVREFCKNSIGKKMRIRRLGKDVIITIKEDD